jgi:hypothetical protein
MEMRGLWSKGTISDLMDVSLVRGSGMIPLWVASTMDWSARQTRVQLECRLWTEEMSVVIVIEHPESRFASPEGWALPVTKKEQTVLDAVTSISEPAQPENLAWMAAFKFILDAAIQFKLGQAPPSESMTKSNSVAWAFGHQV